MNSSASRPPSSNSPTARSSPTRPPPATCARRAPIAAPGTSPSPTWTDNNAPRLNNTPLKLKQNEKSRSLAIAPDGERFLLGTDWYIRLFNRNGKELWNVPAPGVAWAVNISGDGQLALAAYGDGTIRWYRMTDGKELLAFFPHDDRKRWVVWTPSGYYDASAGAEELIGWHVNNGRDAAADFFPAGQFRNDVSIGPMSSRACCRRATSSWRSSTPTKKRGARRKGGRRATVAAGRQIIVAGGQCGSHVQQRDGALHVRTPSGEPVTEVKALVDGRPARARGNRAQASGAERNACASCPSRCRTAIAKIAVIAANRFTTSVPARCACACENFRVARPRHRLRRVGDRGRASRSSRSSTSSPSA